MASASEALHGILRLARQMNDSASKCEPLGFPKQRSLEWPGRKWWATGARAKRNGRPCQPTCFEHVRSILRDVMHEKNQESFGRCQGTVCFCCGSKNYGPSFALPPNKPHSNPKQAPCQQKKVGNECNNCVCKETWGALFTLFSKICRKKKWK